MSVIKAYIKLPISCRLIPYPVTGTLCYLMILCKNTFKYSCLLQHICITLKALMNDQYYYGNIMCKRLTKIDLNRKKK